MSVASDEGLRMCIGHAEDCLRQFIPVAKFKGNYCPNCRTAMELKSNND